MTFEQAIVQAYEALKTDDPTAVQNAKNSVLDASIQARPMQEYVASEILKQLNLRLQYLEDYATMYS